MIKILFKNLKKTEAVIFNTFEYLPPCAMPKEFNESELKKFGSRSFLATYMYPISFRGTWNDVDENFCVVIKTSANLILNLIL